MKKSINHFLWFCAGAKIKYLEHCDTEHVKYAGIGITVLCTGILAFLSGGYAFYTVFGNWWLALGFALIWSLVIFFLDRYIVSSIRKQGNLWRELLTALPRFLIAIVISFVVSNPLELKLFEKEIDLQLKTQLSRFEKESLAASPVTLALQKNEADQQGLQQSLDTKYAKLQSLRDTLTAEIQGRLASRLYGEGPAARSINRNIDTTTKEIKALEAGMTVFKLRNDSLTQARQQQVNGLLALKAQTNSFLARNLAFAELRKEQPFAQVVFYMLALLILLLECAPIIVKLMAAQGPYDKLIDRLEMEQMSADETLMAVKQQEAAGVLKNSIGAQWQTFDAAQQQSAAIMTDGQKNDKVIRHLQKEHLQLQGKITKRLRKLFG
jgi:hypothetical protein